jgi:DNA-binding MarR family transcriptional regulator
MTISIRIIRILINMGFDLDTAPGHLIRRAQQRHQALWTQIVGGELTSVQFALLVLLRDHPELDQRTLAERTSTDTSTLAEVCRRLEQRGLLSRERDAEDRRRYVLRVTPEGEDLLHRVTPDVARVGEALLDGLTEDERSLLPALLRKLI